MSLPTPITREERYLNGIAQGDTSNLPTPVGREEKYLDYIARNGGGGGGGTTNYNALDNKPQIAGTTLEGNKTLADLGIASAEALADKVDKEAGKGLSENDYSDTEKGKVAANAEAIGAIVNVTGSCNVLPNNASTTTVHGATLTINTDKTVTIERATPDGSWVIFKLSDNVLIKAGTYTLTPLYSGSEKDDVYLVITDMSDVTLAKTEGVESVEYTFASDTAVRFYISIKPDAAISTPITFKPMLYDARLTPTGYVPYAMTNRELTERVVLKTITPTIDTSKVSVNSISCIVYQGWCYIRITQMRFVQSGYTQTGLITGLPPSRGGYVGVFIGDDPSYTAQLNSSGDMFWISDNGTSLNAHIGSTNELMHNATIIYPTY